ncbi:TPA: hypothetical protein ACPZV2_001271 [Escherichia coli]|nr:MULTISPECIES: hypothetical protein [Enterobacteriaceae]MDH0256002.1 hypothetical protein [Escherichia coli]MDH0261988.1 hypothetical protein [Escherichia coli]MED8826343.1 hypothetical protein [Escherichia coli]
MKRNIFGMRKSILMVMVMVMVMVGDGDGDGDDRVTALSVNRF